MRYRNIVKIAFLLLPILAVFDCEAINTSGYPGVPSFVSDVRLQIPKRLPDVSLSIIKTAEAKTLEAFVYSGGSWITPRVIAHSAVLVRHPKGTFLFDTGLGDNVDEQFKQSMPFWLKPLMAYKQHKSVKTFLAGEVKQQPIRFIILSHMHWDHVSGIKDFPSAEVWTTKEEYDWATRPDAPEGPYIKSQYSGEEVKWRFIKFEGGPYENFDRSMDVFRDGSVVLISLQGHTPGGIGMFVNLKSGTRLFFTGDATWALEGFRLPAHKFWIPSLLVDHNKDNTERAIIKVHRLMQEYPEMVIIPTHDDNAQSVIGFFPKFVR